MNELKIIHGNITLSNILLSIDKINKISIKLSDYGLNKSLKYNLNSQSYLFPKYTNSPEILQGNVINEKSDIWSLGTIIYFMLFNEYPFNGENEVI